MTMAMKQRRDFAWYTAWRVGFGSLIFLAIVALPLVTADYQRQVGSGGHKFSLADMLTIMAILLGLLSLSISAGAYLGSLIVSGHIISRRIGWAYVFAGFAVHGVLFVASMLGVVVGGLSDVFAASFGLGMLAVWGIAAFGVWSGAMTRAPMPKNCCQSCGYDLRHLPASGGRCPECGAASPGTALH